MKSIKFFALSLCLVFLVTNVSFAQTDAAGMNLSEEEKAEMKANLEEFATTLNLSEEQKTQFSDISQKYMVQMISLRDSDASRWSKYKQVKSIRKNRNAEVETILNEEQYDLYLDKQKEMQKKMKARMNSKS